jgi:hypothetical protein
LSEVLVAAGLPNEYDTGTFNGYDRITKPNGVFDRFFNDPKVQTTLHVRGHNLPGINFKPEPVQTDANVDGHGLSKGYYTPPVWKVCNDDIGEVLPGKHPQSAVPALQLLIQHIRYVISF